MIKSVKIMLNPNNKQTTKLFQYSGASRFIYNWTLAKQKENRDLGGKFIQDNILRKEITQMKKTEEYNWLNSISNNVMKQACKDACDSYKKFFKGYSKFPRFKSRRESKPSFYQDNIKIQFSNTHVKVEGFTSSKKKNKQKVNWIRLCEKNRIPTDCKYSNPRISFDGLNWFISVGLEYEDNTHKPTNEGIGIDLGIKDLAICSDGTVYKNINKTSKVKKLKKRKRRLQRKVSNKYLINKKGVSYVKTSNIIKLEKQLLKLNKRLTGIRTDYMHKATTEIVNREPKFIALEDLNIKGMMKNKHLAKAIQEQSFYEFKRVITYKALWNNIDIIDVPRFYPSSKTCSECGGYKKDLKLSDREYKCEYCGSVIDRDLNASINLAKYQQLVA